MFTVAGIAELQCSVLERLLSNGFFVRLNQVQVMTRLEASVEARIDRHPHAVFRLLEQVANSSLSDTQPDWNSWIYLIRLLNFLAQSNLFY